MPEATAAAAPPDDPPGVIFVFQGLRVTPVSVLSVVPLIPNAQARDDRRLDVP